MTLTVTRLLADRRLGLTLVGGAAGTDRRITWAHAIELPDPTPWLSGGELVMTTGLQLSRDPEDQRAYVRRLAACGTTALAVDTGTVLTAVPDTIRAEADALGFPVLGVAPDVPFIAIGRAVSDALAADDVAAAKRVADQQQRLARAALTGGIPHLVQALAAALSADVLVVDARDAVLASAGREVDGENPLAQQLVSGGRTRHRGVRVDATGHVTSQSLGVAGVERGRLLVATREALHAAQRLLVSHAVSLISMEMEKPAEVLTVERRLRAGMLRALLRGALDDDISQVCYFGFSPDALVTATVFVDVGPLIIAERQLDEALARTGVPYLSAGTADSLVALLPSPTGDGVTESVYAVLRQGLERSISAGVGSASSLVGAVTSYRQAMAAARAGRLEGRRLLHFEKLSTYDLLLGSQSKEALDAVAASALGPLDRYDATRQGDLVRSLEAFLAHNGQWEAAAAALGVHRHTMRNRMAKVAELLGRDVESAHVRAELWLAVKARELVRLHE
jgi:purine catabolism regulator